MNTRKGDIMTDTVQSMSALADLYHKKEKLKLCEDRISKRCGRLPKSQSRVDGGIYKRKPVNKEAAMMLAKAPWWAKFDGKENIKTEDRKMAREFKTGDIRKLDLSCAEKTVGGKDLYDTDELAKCLLRHIKEKYPPQMHELARAALDSRDAMHECVKGIGFTMSEFDHVMEDSKRSMRTSRMTVVSECSSIVNALKDIRQFFLGPDYEKERARLSEFVDLCERLKALKDSGFLDTVADTMMRLDSRN